MFSKTMFTLLRIRFYPFSYRSVLPVHTAPGTFENGMKKMKCSHCSALDKKENDTNWFTALVTANKLFNRLIATNIAPSSILTSSIRFRCSHCVFRFQKSPFSKGHFKSIRFRCGESKVKTDTFYPFSLDSGAMWTG